MEKVNFNDAGLQQLLQDLYLLDNLQLQEEAMQLKDDLRQWLKAHFNFNELQLADLDGMDESFIEDSALQLSYFILNRLPVTLYKPESPSALRGEDRGKLYRNEQKNSTTYNATLGSSQSKTLSFSITYLNPVSS